jgi:hypothetical protein
LIIEVDGLDGVENLENAEYFRDQDIEWLEKLYYQLKIIKETIEKKYSYSLLDPQWDEIVPFMEKLSGAQKVDLRSSEHRMDLYVSKRKLGSSHNWSKKEGSISYY